MVYGQIKWIWSEYCYEISVIQNIKKKKLGSQGPLYLDFFLNSLAK